MSRSNTPFHPLRRLRAATALVLGCLTLAPAMAMPVTYNFSGQVTLVGWPFGGHVGDLFSGSFSFDTEPVLAERSYPFTAFSLVIESGATPLSLTASQLAGHLSDGVDHDGVQVLGSLSGGPGDIYGGLTLQGGTAGYDSANIVNPLNLAGFTGAGMQIFTDGTSRTYLDGKVTALVLAPAAGVPEPATWGLVGAGLFAVARSRRRASPAIAAA